MGRQFLQENTVENSVKGFPKAQVDNIHRLSLIYLEGHLVTQELQLDIITSEIKGQIKQSRRIWVRDTFVLLGPTGMTDHATACGAESDLCQPLEDQLQVYFKTDQGATAIDMGTFWLLFSCCQPTPPDPFLLGSFLATLSPAWSTAGVVVTQGQDLALDCLEYHPSDLRSSIQPVKIPLQSLPALQQINILTQLGVICQLTDP
ncbi:hypothetical protein HGM15179_011607 [Zosterops borbonicus]|uniref:Uncharacterized protein n=1 Tax=Zosterops borbonicus TaxID=364589 RepID=A0A8K1LJ15_9PASS|nr:hypothetical protein HGM15179_011607 [Zosterops borbonicus]